MFMSNGKKTDYMNSFLTCSVAASITRAFGTSNAVLVFLISVTDTTGIEIWRAENTLFIITILYQRIEPKNKLLSNTNNLLQLQCRTLVSLPNTLEWKQIQLSEMNILP